MSRTPAIATVAALALAAAFILAGCGAGGGGGGGAGLAQPAVIASGSDGGSGAGGDSGNGGSGAGGDSGTPDPLDPDPPDLPEIVEAPDLTHLTDNDPLSVGVQVQVLDESGYNLGVRELVNYDPSSCDQHYCGGVISIVGGPNGRLDVTATKVDLSSYRYGRPVAEPITFTLRDGDDARFGTDTDHAAHVYSMWSVDNGKFDYHDVKAWVYHYTKVSGFPIVAELHQSKFSFFVHGARTANMPQTGTATYRGGAGARVEHGCDGQQPGILYG